MKLTDLRTSLLEMTHEERRQFILNVRKERRIRKDSPKKKKAAVQKRSALDKLIDGMNPDELADLVSRLEGGA